MKNSSNTSKIEQYASDVIDALSQRPQQIGYLAALLGNMGISQHYVRQVSTVLANNPRVIIIRGRKNDNPQLQLNNETMNASDQTANVSMETTQMNEAQHLTNLKHEPTHFSADAIAIMASKKLDDLERAIYFAHGEIEFASMVNLHIGINGAIFEARRQLEQCGNVTFKEIDGILYVRWTSENKPSEGPIR